MNKFNTPYYQKYTTLIVNFNTIEEKSKILKLSKKYEFEYGLDIKTILPNENEDKYLRFCFENNDMRHGKNSSIKKAMIYNGFRYEKIYPFSELHMVECILKHGMKMPNYKPRRKI